jgi:hypothetical protein
MDGRGSLIPAPKVSDVSVSNHCVIHRSRGGERVKRSLLSITMLVAAGSTPAAGQQSQATETDRGVKMQRILGAPGGTSLVDLSRAGLDAILESSGGDTHVSIRAGVQAGFWLFDATLKSAVDANDRVSAVAVAGKEPLSSSGSFTVGATYQTNLKLSVDSSAVSPLCTGVARCETANRDLSDDTREAIRSHITVTSATILGAKVTLTRPSFTYRLAPGAADVERERHTGVAATGAVGHLVSDKVYVGLSGGYERAWKGADDPINVCTPFENTPTVSQCVETVIGEPDDQEGAVVAAVVRYFAKRFVVAPRFEYRKTKDLKTLDVPVYFIPESNGAKLTGGVMYRLKNGDSSVFAFVGTAVPGFGLP